MKIRYKVLLLFLLVAMIPLILSSSWAIYTLRNQQLEAMSGQQLNISQALSDRLLTFVREKAEKFTIQIIQPLPGEISLEQQQYILQDIISRDSAVDAGAIFDADGYVSQVLDSNGKFSISNENLVAGELYQAVMAGEIYLGDIKRLPESKTMILGLPMFNSQKQIIGGLRLLINLESLDHLVNDLTLGENTAVYVLDKYLQTVTFSSNISEARINELTFINDVNLFNSLAKGEILSYKGTMGFPTMAKFQKINELNWWVVVEQPNLGLQQYVNGFSVQVLLIFLISLLIVAVISLIFTNRISNPINKLIEGSQVISQGNFKYRIKIPTNDEIEQLGSEFNAMAESLEKICRLDNSNKK